MNKVIEIDIKKCFRALKKSINFIILVTLVFLLFGIFAGLFLIDQNDRYKATATVYNTSYSNSENPSRSMEHLSGIFSSRGVAERAAEIANDNNIDASSILKMSKCTYDPSGNKAAIISISAYSANKSRAIKVANAASDAFVLEVADLTGQDDIQTLDKAIDATIYYSASNTRIKTIILITFLGAFIACAIIVLREILSPKMYSSKDATAYGTLDIIGVIPEFKQKK